MSRGRRGKGLEPLGEPRVRAAVHLQRPLAQVVGQQAPDHEVERGARQEEGGVQIEALVVQDLVVRGLGGGPLVDPGQAEGQGQEEEHGEAEGARARLQDAPDHDAPGAAGEVVDHGDAHAPHADPDPEQEREQPGAEELRRVQDEPQQAAQRADAAAPAAMRRSARAAAGRRAAPPPRGRSGVRLGAAGGGGAGAVPRSSSSGPRARRPRWRSG